MHRVGMIGLGKMGLPIARNLMERGFAVTGYRRSGSSELAAAGGTVAGSAAEVAAGADVLLSIVPDAAAVDEVIAGPAGTLTALRPGTVHIEMSTIDVADARSRAPGRGPGRRRRPAGLPDQRQPRHGRAAARHHLRLRRPRPASTRSAPVLDAISGPWVYTGEFGTGARLKYIANLLLAVHTVAAAEAMDLARRAGLDLELVQHTLDGSIAESAIWRQRGPVMARRALVARPGPVAHAAPDPGADRGLRRAAGPDRPGVRRGQGGLRQGPRRRLGRPRHRLRA